jgi:uncharacterized membrane protein YtjA (UPF0391 family)
MLGWAVFFLLLAVATAILGFGGFVVGTLMWAAKVCAIVFVVLFLISLFAGRNTTSGPGAYY